MKRVNQAIRILVIVALVVMALTIAFCIYAYFVWPAKAPAVNANQVSNDAPRQEIYDKYFKNISLDKTVYGLTDAPKVTWQLKSGLLATTNYILKIVDNSQNIFIAETAPQLLKGQGSAAFENPKRTGDFELWVLLAETDNIQTLAAVLPFKVQ